MEAWSRFGDRPEDHRANVFLLHSFAPMFPRLEVEENLMVQQKERRGDGGWEGREREEEARG